MSPAAPAQLVIERKAGLASSDRGEIRDQLQRWLDSKQAGRLEPLDPSVCIGLSREEINTPSSSACSRTSSRSKSASSISRRAEGVLLTGAAPGRYRQAYSVPLLYEMLNRLRIILDSGPGSGICRSGDLRGRRIGASSVIMQRHAREGINPRCA